MKEEKNKKDIGYVVFFLSDFLSYLISLTPGVLTALITFYVFHDLLAGISIWAVAPLIPLFVVLNFILVTFVIRILLPKLKKGVYKMSFNRGFLSWYLNLALSRSSIIFGLTPFINAFYFSKYLYWRALGADVDYGVTSSITVGLVDYPMLSIRKGCTLADEVLVSAHTFVGDKLLLGEVIIEENVFVGLGCTIGPRTKIGAGSWIGMHNLIGNVRLPAGSKVQNYEWEHGKKSTNPESQSSDSPA